jgi:hypothetical protein
MNEEQARQFLTQLYSNLSPEEEYNLRHQDYVMEMPQSGERFRGRENMRAFQRARGNHAIPPRSLKLRRVLVKEGLWVAEAVIDYGVGTPPSRSRHRSGGRSGSSGWKPKPQARASR